jgi:hypothetical protein
VLLTGCGAGTGSGGDTTADSNAVVFSGCRADDPAVRHAQPLKSLDLDGDGQQETVRVTAPGSGACADALVVTVGGRTSGLSLKDTGINRGSAKAVQPQGSDRQILYLTGRSHPRGGFQPYVVALGGRGLAEVTSGGHPVLPFVATDGGGQPTTATCTRTGGIATLTATVHEPPGIILAWDLRRTGYVLHGATATETSSGVVAKAVADPVLRKQRPELYAPTFFADCTVAG